MKKDTSTAGEAFVESFANVTKSMLAQSKALARTVSLAQVLDMDRSGSEDKENEENRAQSRSGSAYRETILNDLRSLDTIVAGLERRAAELRATIDRERHRVAEMKDIRETARQRTDDLVALCERLPQHLPHAAPSAPFALSSSSAVPTTMDASSHCGGGGCTDPPATAPSQTDHDNGGSSGACRVAPAALSVVPTVELVTVSELERVARSTRGRLTIAVVNDAVTEIQKAIERRQAFLAKPRAKLSEKLRRRLEEIQQQKVPEHGGEPFLSEPDLRALPAFKKGEVTAKALISTLRSLKRLKGVRGSGVMTYVVQGTYH